MKTFGKLVSGISSFFEFNKATLSGALDVIVVEHEDGTMLCNPFRIRFGKLKLLKSSSQPISITINGNLSSIQMRLSQSGEGYFPINEESLSPIFEEQKSVYNNSETVEKPVYTNSLDVLAEGLAIESHRNPLQILPKKGDFCDDLLAGDEEFLEEEDLENN